MTTIWRHCHKPNFISSSKFILLRHLLYSTSSTPPQTTTKTPIEGSVSSSNSLAPLINLLVGSLGFSQKQALSTSTKLAKLRKSRGAKEVSSLTLLTNANSVLDFLSQKGLQKPQIKSVVINVPRVLATRIDQTLQPKFILLQDLGFSESDAAQFMANQCGILLYGVGSTLRPVVDVLRGVLGSDENVVKVIKRLNWRDFPQVSKDLGPNVALLRAQGIPIESIQKCLLHQSRQFLLRTPKLKEIIAKAEEKWGISPHSGMFLYAIRLLGCFHGRTIESKCRVFESFGWGRADVVSLFGKNPHCLARGEGTVKVRLRFYMNELGYDPSYIVAHPAILLYSFERRVLPRYGVFRSLKDKGLIREDYSFYSAVVCSESVFLKKFIIPFRDAMPNLLDAYAKSIDSSAHQHGQRRKKPLSSKTKLKG